MNQIGIGDLSSLFVKQMNTTRVKVEIDTISNELATGRVQDIGSATKGSLGILSNLDAQIGSLKSFQIASNEAELFAGTLQSALGAVQENAENFAPVLLGASDSISAAWIEATAADARTRLSSVVSNLNTGVADRALLGGTATDRPPLADAETMLGELVTAIAGETTAVGVRDAIEAWFGPGGDFETLGYQGSNNNLDTFRVAPDLNIAMAFKASDGEIRNVLEGYALAAVIDAGALDGDRGEQADLLRIAGEQLLTANSQLVTYRGVLGSKEASIEQAQARTASQLAALEIAKGNIVSADPFESAIELEAAQVQLETIFAMTARMSGLNLTAFLR
ncbi:MAG: flagellin [Pseudomonadota bacterium]